VFVEEIEFFFSLSSGSPSFLANLKKVLNDCKERNENMIYVCDPVLGDDGHFYVPQEMGLID